MDKKRKLILAAVCVILLLSLSVLLFLRQPGEDKIIAQAIAFQKSGNFTKAEATLVRAIEKKPSIKLYTALSQVFVAQDKLRDAVALLDNISDPELSAQLQSLRPDTPTASLPSGIYHENLSVLLQSGEGTLYLSPAPEYPSTGVHLDDHLKLTTGDHFYMAVAVGENGLVSPLSSFHYTVTGVVEQVFFADPVLEDLVRQQLRLSDSSVILTSMLWDVKALELPETVTTCADLVWFSNLEQLTIHGVPVTDSRLWQNLPALKRLSIFESDVGNQQLRSIASLPNLRELTLQNCNISNITPLQSCIKLAKLSLTCNLLGSLEPLRGLASLEHISVSNNAGITSLRPLLDCESLKLVDAYGTGVTTVDSDFLQRGITVNLGNNKNIQ